MGEKLLSYFEKAKEMGGFKAQMRLSIITKISTTKANSEPDSLENIKIFEDAMREIEKEFK